MRTFQIMFTSFDRNASGEEILSKALEAAGGKRRTSLHRFHRIRQKGLSAGDKNIPEIIAHAVGTVAVKPGVKRSSTSADRTAR